MARPEGKLKELKTAELRHEPGARRDLVVTLNRRSAPRLIAYGDDFWYEKLPAGTRVIYPPPPLEPLADPDAAIRYALLRPENADPLFAQLNPNMRVTIAIDDISLPLPQMRRPDIRERALNIVLQTLADYGVDDVHLIVATSLHRRMTEAEIRRMVGERAFKQFWPERLYNFDAENRSELAMLGKTDHGEEVWLSRRAVESDLLLYLNINLVPMDGGHKSVAVGLAPYQSLRHHHNPATLRECHSYMDPTRSALHHSANRMGRLVNEHVNVFTIETAINNQMYGGMLDFLQKNEDRFSDWDRMRLKGFRWTLGNMSDSMRRQVLNQYAAPYSMTGVWAGETDAVHRKALARVFQQYAVPVKGQSDVLIVGVPYVCPYNVNSVMNPVLVQCTGPGLPVQYVPRQAAGTRRRHRDHLSSAARPVPSRASSELHRVLPSLPARNHRRRRTGTQLRGRVRAQPDLRSHVPLRPRLSRRASVLHVVLGRTGSPARRTGNRGRMRGA